MLLELWICLMHLKKIMFFNMLMSFANSSSQLEHSFLINKIHGILRLTADFPLDLYWEQCERRRAHFNGTKWENREISWIQFKLPSLIWNKMSFRFFSLELMEWTLLQFNCLRISHPILQTSLGKYLRLDNSNHCYFPYDSIEKEKKKLFELLTLPLEHTIF